MTEVRSNFNGRIKSVSKAKTQTAQIMFIAKRKWDENNFPKKYGKVSR